VCKDKRTCLRHSAADGLAAADDNVDDELKGEPDIRRTCRTLMVWVTDATDPQAVRAGVMNGLPKAARHGSELASVFGHIPP